MTRKEMITYCVEDQIRRGIIKEESKANHIAMRLNGWNKMSASQCKRWFEEVKANQ